MQLTAEEEFRLYGCLMFNAEEALDAVNVAEQLTEKLEAFQCKVAAVVTSLEAFDSSTLFDCLEGKEREDWAAALDALIESSLEELNDVIEDI